MKLNRENYQLIFGGHNYERFEISKYLLNKEGSIGPVPKTIPVFEEYR